LVGSIIVFNRTVFAVEAVDTEASTTDADTSAVAVVDAHHYLSVHGEGLVIHAVLATESGEAATSSKLADTTTRALALFMGGWAGEFLRASFSPVPGFTETLTKNARTVLLRTTQGTTTTFTLGTRVPRVAEALVKLARSMSRTVSLATETSYFAAVLAHVLQYAVADSVLADTVTGATVWAIGFHDNVLTLRPIKASETFAHICTISSPNTETIAVAVVGTRGGIGAV